MKKETFIFLIILSLGFFLRFFYLTQVPSELNRDEASIGFNAYSLLKTGKDEHGRGPWPLIFRAFGDYKIPGYIYLTVPLIKIFGLNAFSVRLPAAFFGFLTLITFYLFIKELFPKRKNLALWACFLLSISPFHLHYSRQQFETTVSLFFSLTGILFLLKAKKDKKLFIISLIFLIISLFIYNSALFIVPLLAFWTFLVYKKDYFKTSKSKLFSFLFVIFLILGWFTYWTLVKEGNQGRAKTTIFNQEKTTERIIQNIYFLTNKGFPTPLARFFHNKPLFLIKSFLKNYLAAFNPKFIFFTSDDNPWHSLSYLNFGNILIVFLPFIFLGFFQTVKNIKEKNNLWLAGYFLLSPIANGLTVDSPILTRLLDFHLILVFFAALGVDIVWQWQVKRYCLKNILITGLLTIATIDYLFAYFAIFPQNLPDFWLPGIKEVCQMIKKEEKKYDYVFFDPTGDVGYIFLAFYTPFDPYDFQKNAKRINPGFDTASAYGKYVFEQDISDINRNEYLKNLLIEKKNILLVKRLRIDQVVHEADDNIIIHDSLGRALWVLTKHKFN